jgi:hypothetical protein
MERIRPQSGGHVAHSGEAQHETSDVNIKLIVGSGVFLVVCGIIVHLVLFGFYKILDREFEKMNPPANPMIQTEVPTGGSTMKSETAEETSKRLNRTFGGNALNPMLQVDDVRDMDLMRNSQNAQIDEYHWLNKDTGSVTIPVERAMDLLVQRGLPNVPALPAGKAAAKGGAAPGANAPTPNAQTNPPSTPSVGPKK